MVLLSGLTLAFVVLLIAGAAAAAPKDDNSATEQRAVAPGYKQTGAGEDIRPDEAAQQTRRAKRGRSNPRAVFGSSEEEEEPFWAARGRRDRSGAAEEERQVGQIEDPAFPRSYGLGWVFPQKRSVGSSEEDDVPFWASRGRRCCNQVKGVVDLKRSYGKDRVRALVAKIIAGNGGAEAEGTGSDDDVFWAARGKRRRGEAAEEARREEEGSRPRL